MLDIKIEDFENRSDNVAAHVSQCAGSKIPPAPPVERHHILDVIMIFSLYPATNPNQVRQESLMLSLARVSLVAIPAWSLQQYTV
jgi:hypothetical protein